MTATRKWSALAVLLVAAIFAASWFLLIAPKRSDAAGLRSQKAEQDAPTRPDPAARGAQGPGAGPAQAGGVPGPDPPAAARQPGAADPDPRPHLRGREVGCRARPRSRPEPPVALLAPVVAVPTAPAATTAPGDGGQRRPHRSLHRRRRRCTGAHHGEDHRQLLRDGAVPQQARGTQAVVPRHRLLAQDRGAGASRGQTAPRLALEIKGRVFLSPAAAIAASATAPAVTPPSTAPAAN